MTKQKLAVERVPSTRAGHDAYRVERPVTNQAPAVNRVFVVDAHGDISIVDWDAR